ncbi:MAG TPA: hypothetical protein VK465_15495, partial [Fibrobacteria bacterium]|nr:hypothetical protein [Fibrobacteria bacterium]
MTMHRYAALVALLLAPLVQAQVPVQEMDARSMSVGYAFGLRGQNITGAQIPSHEVAHRLVLGYAPVPYASLQAGVGLERFAVDPTRQADFDGDYNLSTSFGAALHSPAFAADILRANGGVDFQTFRSEDGAYRYRGLVTNPFLGLVASPTAFLDAAVGARLHFVDGTMEAPRKEDQTFANTDI